MRDNQQAGSISVLILIFGVVATITAGVLIGVMSNQVEYGRRAEAREQALSIAESGIQQFRWRLAHTPDDHLVGLADIQTETPDSEGWYGPYEVDYYDHQGGKVGVYALSIQPPQPGYSLFNVRSEGYMDSYPSISRRVQVSFGIPSLARYSFLHNANVWFGTGLTVHGRVLSNGGIRQDGVNDSIIQSAKETYTCGQESGCSPSEEMPGVWGSGGPDELWEYPVPPTDFDAVSIDFSQMRQAAQETGVYLEPQTNGYRLTFRDTGVVDVYRVNNTQRYRGYDIDDGCQNRYERILNTTLLGSYDLDEYNLFFAESTVWVEGVVNGRATVVAARFPLGTYNENIWINNSVVYLDRSGDHSLGLIAQNNIYFGKDVPNQFEVNAAMLAQNGKIMRHHYGLSWCGNYNNAVRQHLEIYGSVISNQKSYWNWGSDPNSGFEERNVVYDANLYLVPPPYFPASGEYEIITWDEVDR